VQRARNSLCRHFWTDSEGSGSGSRCRGRRGSGGSGGSGSCRPSAYELRRCGASRWASTEVKGAPDSGSTVLWSPSRPGDPKKEHHVPRAAHARSRVGGRCERETTRRRLMRLSGSEVRLGGLDGRFLGLGGLGGLRGCARSPFPCRLAGGPAQRCRNPASQSPFPPRISRFRLFDPSRMQAGPCTRRGAPDSQHLPAAAGCGRQSERRSCPRPIVCLYEQLEPCKAEMLALPRSAGSIPRPGAPLRI